MIGTKAWTPGYAVIIDNHGGTHRRPTTRYASAEESGLGNRRRATIGSPLFISGWMDNSQTHFWVEGWWAGWLVCLNWPPDGTIAIAKPVMLLWRGKQLSRRPSSLYSFPTLIDFK